MNISTKVKTEQGKEVLKCANDIIMSDFFITNRIKPDYRLCITRINDNKSYEIELMEVNKTPKSVRDIYKSVYKKLIEI